MVYSYLCLLVSFFATVNSGALPYASEDSKDTKKHSQITATEAASHRHDYVDAPIEPSQDVKDFVKSIFRGNADTLLDTSEELRPSTAKDEPVKANDGYEQYWPGGEWVYTKAEYDFCNTTGDTCSPVYKNYGKICAADAQMTVHETFENMCEMMDANCRDGTQSIITTHSDVDLRSSITYFPAPADGFYFHIYSTYESHIILSPTKDWVYPNFVLFWFEGFNKKFRIYPGYYYQPAYKYWYWTYQCYNAGSEFRIRYVDGYYSLVSVQPDGSEGCYVSNNDKYGFNFPVKYFGVNGGTPEKPTRWVFKGQLRGWVAAYRGECQGDLATIPTLLPLNLKTKYDLDMYNFAERMDEFGYNFSRPKY